MNFCRFSASDCVFELRGNELGKRRTVTVIWLSVVCVKGILTKLIGICFSNVSANLITKIFLELSTKKNQVWCNWHLTNVIETRLMNVSRLPGSAKANNLLQHHFLGLQANHQPVSSSQPVEKVVGSVDLRRTSQPSTNPSSLSKRYQFIHLLDQQTGGQGLRSVYSAWTHVNLVPGFDRRRVVRKLRTISHKF